MKSSFTNQRKGFTLAEVLITLAIIGVVAALTIPTLITNYQKHQYVTQLKKNYNVLSNGFKTIMAKDGVSKLSDTTLWTKFGSTNYFQKGYIDTSNTDLQAFLSELSKTFSIINTSSTAVTYKYLNAGADTEAGSSSNGIILKDGTIIYYSFDKTPYTSEGWYQPPNTPGQVGSFDIDVNGEKGPNQYGRDLFSFYLYNDGSLHPKGSRYVAAWMGDENSYHYWQNDDEGDGCFTTKFSFGTECAARIMEEGWQMKY